MSNFTVVGDSVGGLGYQFPMETIQGWMEMHGVDSNDPDEIFSFFDNECPLPDGCSWAYYGDETRDDFEYTFVFTLDNPKQEPDELLRFFYKNFDVLISEDPKMILGTYIRQEEKA